MDPISNTLERISIVTKDAPMHSQDTARLRELDRAYADWRAIGGFPADDALLRELRIAREARGR